MKRVLILWLALVAFSMAFAPPAHAHPDFVEIVEEVLPSVVNVSTRPEQGLSAGGEPKALGSGFVVSSDGLVVTNHHVIDGERDIVVIFADGSQYPVTVRGTDVETDLALLKIDADRRFEALSFGDSQSLRVGEWVLAIGNPFGLGSSVSAGIVSGQRRDIGAGLYDNFIQTDAAINKGNSGGPLFDGRGRVIGVNTVIFSQSGGSNGVGFAIPSQIAENVVRQLAAFGKTSRGYLGAFLDDVDPGTQVRLGLGPHHGALVTGIAFDDGPAARAGLQSGDVIIAFNGRRVRGRRDLTQQIADAPVGEPLPVLVNRGGKRQRVTVTLITREQRVAGLADPIEPEVELAGLELQTVSADVARRFDLPSGLQGVVVTGVAHHMGATSLRPGDVILEIGWDEAESVETIGAHLRRLRDSHTGPVQILVRRGDKLFYETLKP
jgi:serine protease Do